MTAPAPPPSRASLQDWALASDAETLTLHASAVALDGRAVVICGAAGRGKSRLALAMIGLGARLVCDDVCLVEAAAPPDPDALTVRRPPGAPPAIALRGLRLLASGPVVAQAEIAAIVDLDRAETALLPPRRQVAWGRRVAPLIRGANRPDLAHELLHLLRFGWAAP